MKIYLITYEYFKTDKPDFFNNKEDCINGLRSLKEYTQGSITAWEHDTETKETICIGSIVDGEYNEN